MEPVTGNYTSEAQLSAIARETLLSAFDAGWADPRKVGRAATKAKILRNQAMESIAVRLGIRVDELEALGEPKLGHFLAIQGFLTPETHLVTSSVDKGVIRAIARAHSGPGSTLPVAQSGAIEVPVKSRDRTLLSLQVANGETGVVQDLERFSEAATFITMDATISGAYIPLGERWDSALFDAKSWNGPAGFAILAIRNSAQWRYPLPHIAPIRVPESSSLPLLLCAAVALENFNYEADDMVVLRKYLHSQILLHIPQAIAVASHENCLPHISSFLFPECEGEEIVRSLAKNNFDVDSGSACSAQDLQPSHVLASMGLSTRGHIRITMRPGTTQDDVNLLVAAIAQSVATLSR